MADNLDVFENRLELLETRVFGGSNKDAHYPKESKPSKCTDVLANVQTNLTKAVAGKKKINRIFDRLPELKECLDPARADEMTLSEAAKTEIILAEEDFLLQQSARLETLQQLQDTLDSEHIKAVPSLTGKLQDLSQLTIKQQDEAGKLSEEIESLLSTYNAIITLLSKQFVKWDETVTKIEQAKSSQKVLD
ncbi:dynactin subunit 3-like isoform X1 [Mercenaria mercenaria]|uniref:dynactin subunit 3-like isoform X1 n=1 Tax=Mercenaria mercenaria TaxID=6596 RepID=UPI001E1DC19D|nr:dynactin subunit 3-like isoform X1 [Mercenaria mercenaria]